MAANTVMGNTIIPREYIEVNELKKRALIYGAGNNFIHHFRTINSLFHITEVVDGDFEKSGKEINGYKIVHANDTVIKERDFDVVIVTPRNNSEIINRLRNLGISAEEIIAIDQIYEKAFCGNSLKIAIMFYGGMGDFLIGKNWLFHVVNRFHIENENWVVFLDSVAYERGKEIFEPIEFVEEVNSIQSEYISLMDKKDEYDVIFRFCIFPYVQHFLGESIRSKSRDFLEYVLRLQKFGLENYCVGFCHNPFFYKTIRTLMETFQEKKYHNYCDVFDDLGIDEYFAFDLPIRCNENDFLNQCGLYQRKFITLDTGLNKDYKGGASTRAWSHKNWNELATVLKKRFPDYLTVQVGEKMSEEDDISADINLNGRTSIDEARVLMKWAAVHIDYDGGLVHVRHILDGGPSVVMFGPTAISRHTYNENIGIRTSACENDCEWTTERWLFDCPKGYKKTKCMNSITPEMVCDEVERLLIQICT